MLFAEPRLAAACESRRRKCLVPSPPAGHPVTGRGNNASRYYRFVLHSFADKDTERVWRRERSRRLDQHTQRAALRKLLILDAAETLDDARIRQVTDWRSCMETVSGHTASGWTSSGASAFAGQPPDPKTSRSPTTTEGGIS